jgi:hypothetical protein
MKMWRKCLFISLKSTNFADKLRFKGAKSLGRKRSIFVRKSIVVSRHFTYLENSIYLMAHKVLNHAS